MLEFLNAYYLIKLNIRYYNINLIEQLIEIITKTFNSTFCQYLQRIYLYFTLFLNFKQFKFKRKTLRSIIYCFTGL